MTVIVIATLVPNPEHREDVTAKLEEVIAQVHTEDGCELYALHTDGERLVMVEKWASQDHLAAHSAGPALEDLRAALDGKLVGELDVQLLQAHPAGTAEQGTL